MASIVYTVKEVQFIYDSSRGTFDKGGGQIRGAIIGFTYTLNAFDDQLIVSCNDGNLNQYRSPLFSMPTRNDILTSIKQDSSASGLLSRLNSCLIQMKKNKDLLNIQQQDSIPDLDGSVLP